MAIQFSELVFAADAVKKVKSQANATFCFTNRRKFGDKKYELPIQEITRPIKFKDLLVFLNKSKANEHKYHLQVDEKDTVEEFVCADFAYLLYVESVKNKIPVKYVTVKFVDKIIQHALVVFYTIEKGLVYVDFGASEEAYEKSIVWIQEGLPYRSIPLELVIEDQDNFESSFSYFEKKRLENELAKNELSYWGAKVDEKDAELAKKKSELDVQYAKIEQNYNEITKLKNQREKEVTVQAKNALVPLVNKLIEERQKMREVYVPLRADYDALLRERNAYCDRNQHFCKQYKKSAKTQTTLGENTLNTKVEKIDVFPSVAKGSLSVQADEN